MLIFEPWKKALIALVCLFGLLTTLPNAFYTTADRYNEAQAIDLQQSFGPIPEPPNSLISQSLFTLFGAAPGAYASEAEIRALLLNVEATLDDHWRAVEIFAADDPVSPDELVADAPRRAIAAYDRLVRMEEIRPYRDAWPIFLPSSTVSLGLDLQGGSHFLLEAQLDDTLGERMRNLWPLARSALREEAQIVGPIRRVSDATDAEALRITILQPSGVERAGEILEGLAQPVQTGTALQFGFTPEPDLDIALEADGQTYRITPSDAARNELSQGVMASVLEVLRTRVDALGTREPTIQRQGVDRVVLQLPGENNVDIDEITRPAQLEFRMVVADGAPARADGRADADVYPYPNDETRVGRIALYNVEPAPLTGAELTDALQGFDAQSGEPVVNLRFNQTGARIFGEITRENVGRRFAILIDGVVITAPRINEPILGGSAQITGGFSVPEASAMAVNLSSGALPVALTVEESTEVGPELGADSIAAGRIACIIGFILVLVYMAASYGLFGMLANTALLINVLLIFGALSFLGATLTLPGIAGIVLTIGMAVDANVLIFERIREELKRGRGVVRAIETGYQRAFSAIIDANVTTFLAAVILFSFGSGPVRGFAVTLGIGIITSVFTAVMLTRFFVATWYASARPKELSL